MKLIKVFKEAKCISKAVNGVTITHSLYKYSKLEIVQENLENPVKENKVLEIDQDLKQTLISLITLQNIKEI